MVLQEIVQNIRFDAFDSLKFLVNVLLQSGFSQLKSIVTFIQIQPEMSRLISHVKITTISTGRGLTVEFADGVGETAVQFCSPRQIRLIYQSN